MTDMTITLSPVRADGALTVARNETVALINGTLFDFGQLADGDRLPRAAVQCPALISDVTRQGAEIRFALAAPHGEHASEAERFPAPVTANTPGLTGPAGVIDWGQKITAAQQAAANLAAWRETATLSRTDFCIALAGAGILTAPEAIAAAKGEIPVSFEPVVAALPDPPQTAVRIRWAAMSTVERNNEFVAMVAQAASIPATVLDGVFGWI